MKNISRETIEKRRGMLKVSEPCSHAYLGLAGKEKTTETVL